MSPGDISDAPPGVFCSCPGACEDAPGPFVPLMVDDWSFILSPGEYSEAPGVFCAYAATAVLTKRTAASALIFFIGSSIASLLLRRFLWCRPGFVSRQSRDFACVLINAAGLTARILLRLCGWTRLVSRQPFNTGSAVWRPGGLRESCWDANHSRGGDQQNHYTHEISSANKSA